MRVASREPTHEAVRAGRRAPGSRFVLLLACAAEFMVVLDMSVMNVALPSVRADLGFGLTSLQWVVNGYALAFAGFLLLGGRIADLWGHRRVFVLGLVLFAGASLVGGLATAPEWLVAARAAQGAGAAVLAPVSLTILTTTFGEGPARTRALAIWTALAVGGGTAGNLLGGALTEYLSWRWTLLINVPVGALAIGIAARVLVERRVATGRHVGLPGAVLATTGMASLTYGITQWEVRGWSDRVTLTTLAAGAAMLGAFALIDRKSQTPLLPLRLLAVRSISVGNGVMFLSAVCFMPMWYFLSLAMQDARGYSPLQTGLGFLPHTLLTIAVGVYVTPRLMRRIDPRWLVTVGALVASAGFLWQSRTVFGGDYVTSILGPAVVFSVGGALFNTPLTSAVTSGTTEADAGAASGLMNTAKQVGGAVGLAALVSVAATPAGQGFAYDYREAFLILAVVLALVALVSLTLPRNSAQPSEGNG